MARILCVVLMSVLLVAAEGEHEEAEGEGEGGKCERIRLPLCQDLGYNWTAMPNLMGHKDQKEAEEAMSVFAESFASGCSAHLRFVVCSAYAPLCSTEVAGAVSACRSVCEEVAAACGAAPLSCAAFPHRPDRRLCMRPPAGPAPAPAPAPRWPAPAPPACPPRHVRAPDGDCWPACGADVQYSRQEKRTVEIWMTALAWVSLVSTGGALLTFCAEPARYRYPERPGVWAAACHAGVALAYLARAWLGAGAVSCTGGALAADGLAAPPCVAFFAVTYYLTLAADAWFANACIAWYLTAASEWSTEALERAGAYLHAGAWGWAGAWTAAALALRRVAADEATGACVVGAGGAAALEAVPRGALLAAGGALALAAGAGVARVRRALGGAGAARVGRLARRAAAAAALYVVLAGGAAAARLAEARGGHGAACSVCARLACGAAAAGWAVSRRSALVWRRALCPPRKCPAPPPPLLRPPPLRFSPYDYKRPPVSRV